MRNRLVQHARGLVRVLPITIALFLAGCGNPNAGTPHERATVGAGQGERERAANLKADQKNIYPLRDNGAS